ncbi:MAG: DUF1599 domain-containing protein [bacterium]
MEKKHGKLELDLNWENIQDKTTIEYNTAYGLCSEVFLNKLKDYGCSWRILRLPSLTDQILIKTMRIRSIQEKGVNKIGDSVIDELIGIANYSVMALIQNKLGYVNEVKSINSSDIIYQYSNTFHDVFDLMLKKNHDYGEAWRYMRVSSMVDLIYTKLLRIKEIEDNDGETIASEGVDGNYSDIVNYAIFSLILLNNEER